MASYQKRGMAHNIIYMFRTKEGTRKQHWETYYNEKEAKKRKRFIDNLQKNHQYNEILKAVMDYKRIRCRDSLLHQDTEPEMKMLDSVLSSERDNTDKTYLEFIEKWLPIHARKNRLAPNTYDSYASLLKNHILPHFGHRIMSSITSEEIDSFIDFLNMKPCGGSIGYYREPYKIPTLSSPTVIKCYNLLMVGFRVAKRWNYIKDIPDTTAPSAKCRKRKAWDAQKVYEVTEKITNDELLHLAVHLAFVCSLRAGETVGIEIATINFSEKYLWITQTVQRVSDKALASLPRNDINCVFPKKIRNSKSSLILKAPKTEGSVRKQYLTAPLLAEIREQMQRIKENKEHFGSKYQDYGLLVCYPDGTPIEPKRLNREFKAFQAQINIDEKIEFQGLRKSGQMHKIRISNNNYQLVAESSGQSPHVLMNYYNESSDGEKQKLAQLVEMSYYPQETTSTASMQTGDVANMLLAYRSNINLLDQFVKMLQANSNSTSGEFKK